MPPVPFRENDLVFKNSPDLVAGYAIDERDAIWIPTEPGVENRFLMFDLNRNTFAVVVRCQPGTVIARHYHMGPVLGYTLQGKWKYQEYDWIATPGTCVYEPPGEAHTLLILGDEVMLSVFHVMGPHIQRARIALVIIGVLYAWFAYQTYGDIAVARTRLHGSELEDAVNVAYYFIVFTGVAGVANIVLAVIAGRATTTAIYAAMGIFVAHSCFQLYLAGVLVFTSWLWWLAAIVLGMGFQAAHKAHKLRRERARA